MKRNADPTSPRDSGNGDERGQGKRDGGLITLLKRCSPNDRVHSWRDSLDSGLGDARRQAKITADLSSIVEALVAYRV